MAISSSAMVDGPLRSLAGVGGGISEASLYALSRFEAGVGSIFTVTDSTCPDGLYFVSTITGPILPLPFALDFFPPLAVVASDIVGVGGTGAGEASRGGGAYCGSGLGRGGASSAIDREVSRAWERDRCVPATDGERTLLSSRTLGSILLLWVREGVLDGPRDGTLDKAGSVGGWIWMWIPVVLGVPGMLASGKGTAAARPGVAVNPNSLPRPCPPRTDRPACEWLAASMSCCIRWGEREHVNMP